MKVLFRLDASTPHEVIVNWHQFWGKVEVSLDGVLVIKRYVIASVSQTRSFVFYLGPPDTMTLEVRKTKKRFNGGVRPQTIELFADGQKVPALTG